MRNDELEIPISKQRNSTILTISSAFLRLGLVILLTLKTLLICCSLCVLLAPVTVITPSHTHRHRRTNTHVDSVNRDYHIRSNFLLHSASNLRHW